MQLIPRASLLAVLLISPLACSSENDGGSGGSAGTGGAGGSTAGASGAATGGNAGSSTGGTQAGGSSAGGSSSVGATGGTSTGGTSTGGAATGGTGGVVMAEQGKCERPEPIGSCTSVGATLTYCVAYYYDLGIDFKAGCEAADNIWSDGGCFGATAGWCEIPGAPYSSTIEYYSIPGATQKTECEGQSNLWCDGKGSLRPECAAGGDTNADCATCRAGAEASGGCCEAEISTCRADADCEAAFDCLAACTDTACFDACFASAKGEAWLAPLGCLFGSFGLDLGACGEVCSETPL